MSLKRKVTYEAADHKDGFTVYELRAALARAVVVNKIRVTMRGRPYAIEVEEGVPA